MSLRYPVWRSRYADEGVLDRLDLVDRVPVGQVVEDGEHGVQHGHNLYENIRYDNFKPLKNVPKYTTYYVMGHRQLQQPM